MSMAEFKLLVTSKNELTDVDLLNLHREYWDFIIKNNLQSKPIILNRNGEEIEIVAACFLCEYAKRHVEENHVVCRNCPADCRIDVGCLGGLYDKWCNAVTIFGKRKYAKKIRDVEIRVELKNTNIIKS